MFRPTLGPRSIAVGGALAFALAAPVLAATPNPAPATPAPTATAAGQQSGPGAVAATTPQNVGASQVAQTGSNAPGQQFQATGPDNEQHQGDGPDNEQEQEGEQGD